MATTLSMEVPVIVTLDATAGNVTIINVPQTCGYVRVRWISGSYGYVTRSIADGASKASAYETYDSAVVYFLSVTPRWTSGKVGLASDTNSGTVELTALPQGR